MSDGKHCPACDKAIGVWSVLSAGLPTRVHCPHCKARLTYGHSFLLLLGVVTMVSLVGLTSYYIASHYLVSSSRITNPLKFYAVVVALVLALWIPMEVAFTLYVRARGVLRKVR